MVDSLIVMSLHVMDYIGKESSTALKSKGRAKPILKFHFVWVSPEIISGISSVLITPDTSSVLIRANTVLSNLNWEILIWGIINYKADCSIEGLTSISKY